MASTYVLLGEGGAAQPSRSSKVMKIVSCVVILLTAAVMLAATMSGLSNSSPLAGIASGANATDLFSVRAAPFMPVRGMGYASIGQGAPRADIFSNSAVGEMMPYITSSPVAKLAINAIECNQRMNQRDISAKAVKKRLVSGWDLVEDDMKQKLLKTIDGVKYKANALAGVTAPLNYFDPLRFVTPASPGKFLFYREVELKHGRIAMLASLGILVGENFHPLFGGNIDTAAINAFQETPLQTFWPAVVAAIAIPEMFSVFTFEDPSKGEQWAMKVDHMPGDLGFDPLNLKPTDEKELVKMQSKELNNGRLAMIAAAGMIAQELVTGEKLF